ncbi:hypothetical protein J31TS4_43210 [Paenibacillus sp. J31TS4]|uniref:hypothetical protein n=1 Tax=Paenibacillus sp. J31TS4 TaxID=2807195 RepID=UPI001B126748|nr:hypothetical protein [Paenibacillus sp. J31TS4]GIP41041.1 hypothetical protein J31TS4_43210 [Paenibacillus sp. J31TS4]
MSDLRSRMQAILQEFTGVLEHWKQEDGTLPDPYETIYSENYAPANAAVVYASAYRGSGRAEHLAGCIGLVRRSVELLQDRSVSPFCRVFLFHYSLMALLLLPERERAEEAPAFAAFYAAYEDDCRTLNTNCAALQWGMELYLEALGYRQADSERLAKLLRHVEEAQMESGFVNDEKDEAGEKDGMPIAYHAFTLFLLLSPLALISEPKPEHVPLFRRAGDVIAKGVAWFRRTVTTDGTFAMTQRSSYQMFTWGAGSALLAAFGKEDERLRHRMLDSWLAYKKPDGSYSCTPNFWPHQLRVGYESYTHVNMYNCLGMTGIALAALLEENEERRSVGTDTGAAGARCIIEWYEDGEKGASGDKGAAEAEDAVGSNGGAGHHGAIGAAIGRPDGPGEPEDGLFLDEASGYAFVRRGERFFGCTLRMHSWGYTPAMQGFHYRAGEIRLPLAEPRFARASPRESLWEGVLIELGDGRLEYPSGTENVPAAAADEGLRLVWSTEHVRVEKEIRVEPGGFAWAYRLTALAPLVSVRQYVPLLVHDGEEGIRAAAAGRGVIRLSYRGRRFVLACDGPGELELSLARSTASVSGIAASAVVTLPGSMEIGDSTVWTTRLSWDRGPIREELDRGGIVIQ